MKIIHIVHGKVNPNGHNGISLVVYNLNKYEKLNNIDSQIWAVVDDTKKHYSYERDNFVTVECYPRVNLPFGKNEIIEDLIKNKDSIDLVHFHLIWSYEKNIIANVLKKNGIPFIITTHGTYSKPHANTGKRFIAKYLYEKKFLNLAKEVHIITREEGTALQQYGYNGKSFVAYNGIDISQMPDARKNDFFYNKHYSKKTKFLWVGVLRDDKNIKSLISAVSMIKEEIKKDLIFIMVGPDWNNNKKKYIELTKELDCFANFDFLGPLYKEDKFNAIESSDCYIMPSFSEVFSLAVIDAMACAKPILLTSGCGLNYISKKTFSVTCEPYAQDLVNGILEIISLKNNWKEMGLVSKKIAEEELDWPKIVKIMIKNYERIINE